MIKKGFIFSSVMYSFKLNLFFSFLPSRVMRKALWCVDYYHSSITGATKNTKLCVSLSYKMKINLEKFEKKFSDCK